MPREYLCAVRQNGQEVNPLFRFLNACLREAEAGRAVIDLPVTMNLAQGAGLVAGGILATIADEAMAHACMSMLAPGKAVVTSEMNVRYLRSTDPRQGGCIRAEARVIKPGRNLFVTEAQVYCSDDRLLATAGATFWVMDKV